MPVETGSKRDQTVPGGASEEEENVRRMRPLHAKTEQRPRANNRRSLQELRSGKLRKTVL